MVAEEVVVSLVGFEPEGEEVADEGEGPDEGVEGPVCDHAEVDAERDFLFGTGSEDGEAGGGGEEISRSGDETDNGVEADALFSAGDFDQIVEDVGHPFGEAIVGFGRGHELLGNVALIGEKAIFGEEALRRRALDFLSFGWGVGDSARKAGAFVCSGTKIENLAYFPSCLIGVAWETWG